MAKFCTKCGKRLEEGEVCGCVRQAAPPQPEAVQSNVPVSAEGAAAPQQGAVAGEQAPPQQTNAYQAPQQQANTYQAPPQQQAPNGQYAQGNARTKEAEWVSQKGSQVLSETKNVFAEILPLLKRPVTHTSKIALKNSKAVGAEFIGAKAVIVLLIMLFIISKIKEAMGLFGGIVEIPYVNLILAALLLTAGLDCLEALLLKVFSGVLNILTNTNAMFTVVGTRALYDALIMVVTSIFALVSAQLAFMFYGITSLILPYVQFGGYRAVVQGDEDKKVYAFFIAKACMLIIIYFVFYLFTKDLFMGILKGAISNGLGNMGSFF